MLSLVAAFVLVPFQDSPVDIPKKELPAKAVCIVCSHTASEVEEEKPAAGVKYKGAAYYFCNSKEVAGFKKDPAGFMPPVLPRPMPAFDLTDESGTKWDASQFKGKVVLFDWWATWCGPCKEMMPTIEKLHSAYKDKGLEVLSVSIDEKRGDLDKFLKGHKFANPVVHDTAKVWSKWGIRSIPMLFLVKDGNVVAQWIGKRDYKAFSAAVEAALR